MPDVVKNARIQLRNDVKDGWEYSSSETPQLLPGEVGFSINQRLLKIGGHDTSSASATPWPTSTQISVSSSLVSGLNPFDLGSGAYMLDYASLFNNKTSIQYLSTIPKALRDPGSNDSWSSAASLKALCTTTVEEVAGVLTPVGDIVSHLLTTPNTSGGSITPPQSKPSNYYYGDGGILLLNMRGSSKETLDIDDTITVDTIFQRLVVAGHCHLEINANGFLDYVSNTGDLLTYEIYERVLSRSHLETFIYSSPWKLVDASYSGSSTVEFITDAEIEDIIGVELEYANGHSF